MQQKFYFNKRGPRRSMKLPELKRVKPVDGHVGARMRLRRMMLGLSLEKLAEALSLTYQQVQKYEQGRNRVSASRLFDLTRILRVPVQYFFNDMPPDIADEHRALRLVAPAERTPILLKRETLELVRNYQRLPGAERDSILQLAKVLAKR